MARARPLDIFLVVVIALAFWQGLFEYVGAIAITPPLATARFALGLLGSASFWPHVGATMLAFLLALVISSVLGVALGLLLGLSRFTGDVAEPIVVSLYTIPKVTLYPVMLLLFGLGLEAKVAFGVIHGMIPVTLFTLAAVKNLPTVYLRTSRTFRLSALETARTILIPALLPEIFNGLCVGFALTLLGVLIGEMFASQRGLGFLIINGINSHNVRMMTAVTLLIVIFAIAANGALLALNRRIHRS
ncbi:MAG: ABC transporter permease [Acetobacteraceae bacterium]